MRRGGGPLAVLALAQAATTYEFTVAFVALPPVVADLGVPTPLVPWVPGAYAVTFGGGLLAAGRAVDRVGARPAAALALLGFATTTTVVALATSPAVLLAGRAGQGLVAAVLQPAVLAAMTRVASGPSRTRAWGVWSAVGAGGLALGAALGGVLGAVSWRLAIGVVVPVCLLAAAGTRVLPTVPGGRGARVPLLGAGVTTAGGLAVAATVTLGAASGWVAPATVAVAGAALAAVSGVVVVGRSGAAVLGEAARRPGVRLGAVLAGLYMAGPGALYFLVTTMLAGLAGASSGRVGLLLLPLTLGVVAGSASAGRVVGRVGEELGAAIGFGLAAVGTGWMAVSLVGPAGLVASSLVAGLGSGVAFTAVFALAARDVPDGQRGSAGAVVVAAQYLASAVALAGYGALTDPAGYRGVLLLAAAVGATGAAVAVIRHPAVTGRGYLDRPC
jgi:MFS family permease